MSFRDSADESPEGTCSSLERSEMIQGAAFLWQIGTHQEDGCLLTSFSTLQLVGEFQPIHPREMIIEEKQIRRDRLQHIQRHLAARGKMPLIDCLLLEHFQ